MARISYVLPADADRIKLMKILSDHGFHAAAGGFREWIDFSRAVAAWENYPACMAHYPTHAKKLAKSRW